MDGTEAQDRAVRRASLRGLPTPTDIELHVDVDPPLLDVVDGLRAPRAPELDALLREVDELRHTMRRDLTLAATAAEAGADELAGWLLLGEDGVVRRFEERAQAHLAAAHDAEQLTEAAVAIPAPRRRSRMLPAAPMVAAAAAIFGFLTGVVPGAHGDLSTPRTANAAALDSYAQLTRLATSGASDRSITAAAQQFHDDLAPLVAAAGSNPAAAEKAIALLQSERVVISAEGSSPALQAVLAQADALVRRLQATLPRNRVRVPVVAPAPEQPKEPRRQSTQTSSPAPKASPTTTPKPSPSPSPKPTSAPTSAPSPSPSSDGGPLPQAPSLH